MAIKVIDSRFGAKKGKIGVHVIVRDAQGTSSFTVHGVEREPLHNELLMHCKALEKVGDMHEKTNKSRSRTF